GCAGSMMVYRQSMLKAAGFEAFPKTTDDFLKMMQALHAKGTPGGLALGHATGDGLWCNWLMWAFGGKLVDQSNKVVISSPESHLFLNRMIMKHTKYPQAAKEFLRFMMEQEQFDPWLTACGGYISQPLAAYEKVAVWTSDPKNTPYRDATKNMRPTGYAGRLGYASAGAGADFIVVDMVAEGISGSKTPQEAMERAQKRAERYYKV